MSGKSKSNIAKKLAFERKQNKDGSPIPKYVDLLEVDKPIGRYREMGRSVVFDGHGSEDALVVEIVPAHRGRFLPLAVPRWRSPEPFLRRFDHAQVLHGSALDTGHMRSTVHIGDIKKTFTIFEIPPGRNNRRPRPGRQRHRIETPGLFDMNQDFVAEYIK